MSFDLDKSCFGCSWGESLSERAPKRCIDCIDMTGHGNWVPMGSVFIYGEV